MRIYSVTGWIKSSYCQQPRGGFVPIKLFKVNLFKNEKELNPYENISPSQIGVAVDYLTRYLITSDITKSFEIPQLGISKAFLNKKIELYTEGKKWFKKLEEIHKPGEISDEFIYIASKLCVWDSYFRSEHESNSEDINPDEDTIENIRIMTKRCFSYLYKKGKIIDIGFCPSIGNVDCKWIGSGDGDFLTEKDLIDIKISKYDLKKTNDTLQLLVYYMLGIIGKDKRFETIENLTIFNPRLNIEWTCPISSIPSWVFEEIQKQW